MYQILIVEDDKTLSTGIAYALRKENLFVYSAYNLQEAKALLNKEISLILLDINLPDGDGRVFLKEIRRENPVPVIFLTARDTEEEMLQGFDAGGDEYITKPFSIPVLIRRMKALLSRIGEQEHHFYYSRDLVYDYEQMILRKNQQEVALTATEHKILEVFLANKNMVITREMMLAKVWDVDENYVEEKTLNVNIRRLREKIEDNPKEPVYIKTVFGIGYKWSDSNEK